MSAGRPRWRSWLLTVATSLVLVLAGCASPSPSRPAQAVLPPPDSTTSSGAYEGETDYRIGAQDLLEISVFGVSDLDRTVRVNSNGQISLPLLGSVAAGGKTIPELERELAKRYAAGYLQNPQVSIFVKEFTSQRVTLEGAVNKPGIYPLTGRTTLLQAIAMAQGLHDLADPQGIVVFRQIDGQRNAAAFDIAAVRRGAAPDPSIYGDDIIVVERSGSRSALREFLRSVPAFALFLAI